MSRKIGQCSVTNCVNVGRVVRGMCDLHYRRWLHRGTTHERSGPHFNSRPTLTPLAILERAASRTVETAEGCWEFQGALSAGYGVIGHKRMVWQIHRFAYIAMVGEVPDGLQLDHLCRNRACWNPYHLEPVTQRVNLQRGHRWAS